MIKFNVFTKDSIVSIVQADIAFICWKFCWFLRFKNHRDEEPWTLASHLYSKHLSLISNRIWLITTTTSTNQLSGPVPCTLNVINDLNIICVNFSRIAVGLFANSLHWKIGRDKFPWDYLDTGCNVDKVFWSLKKQTNKQTNKKNEAKLTMTF